MKHYPEYSFADFQEIREKSFKWKKSFISLAAASWLAAHLPTQIPSQQTSALMVASDIFDTGRAQLFLELEIATTETKR